MTRRELIVSHARDELRRWRADPVAVELGPFVVLGLLLERTSWDSAAQVSRAVAGLFERGGAND